MPPDPIMPTDVAFWRARYLAPIPPPPPTRMCCSTPSLMIASGSPFLVLNSMMRPQKVPGSTQYLFSRHTPDSFCGQVTTSDFMRIAKKPSLAPSIVPQR